jgi:hypothetical protein
LDSSIIQGAFSVAPCQTLISRFATCAGARGGVQVDTSTPTADDAPHVVTYTATDAAGNVASLQRRVTVAALCAAPSHLCPVRALPSPRADEADKTAIEKMQKWRIVLGWGRGTARQEMAFERLTNPTLVRRMCSSRYGLPPCRGKSAVVAKRPRERSPPPKSLRLRFATFPSLYIVRGGQRPRPHPPCILLHPTLSSCPHSARLTPLLSGAGRVRGVRGHHVRVPESGAGGGGGGGGGAAVRASAGCHSAAHPAAGRRSAGEARRRCGHPRYGAYTAAM